MTPLPKNLPPIKVADKEETIRDFDQILAASGVEYGPDMTPEKLRHMMLDEGIRPEDNFLSTELMRTRYPEDYPSEIGRLRGEEPEIVTERYNNAMTTLLKNLPPVKPVDKAELIRAFDEWAAQAGIVLDPDATPEQAQQMMRDAGIRPEDNILTSELLRMRYPDDYPEKDEAK